MGNEHESKYGFKDKEAAVESLKLLEQEDMQYQKLTVRGLLGRAKRVLTLTKAEEKIHNISSAIEVFEEWLSEHDTGSNKNSKPANEDKADTVPGLGFKDKEAAMKTLEILEGRDPEYQKLAVKGLIGSSKRVLSGTKNPDKITSIKEGVEILENFLEEFDRDNRMKDNMKYLNADILSKFTTPQNELVAEFVEIYTGRAKGNYKHLRTLYPSTDDSKTWDIVRNAELKKLNEKIKEEKLPLFKSDGSPSEEHMEMIYWAFSPQADKVKAYADKLDGSHGKGKKRSISPASDSGENDNDDDEDIDSEGDDDDETPSKKKKRTE